MASELETSISKSSSFFESKTETVSRFVSVCQRSATSRPSTARKSSSRVWLPFISASRVLCMTRPAFHPPRVLKMRPTSVFPVAGTERQCGSPHRRRGGLAAQVGENCEHAPVVFRRRREPQLPEDARHVLLDRTERDHETLGDRLVRLALRHQLEHLTLAWCQILERIVPAAAPDELRDDCRIES